MEDVTIKKGAKVYTSIIDSDTVVGAGATVGTENATKDKITVVAKGTEIAPNATVCD
jgi:ADP-glucose pyrophosphorylase